MPQQPHSTFLVERLPFLLLGLVFLGIWLGLLMRVDPEVVADVLIRNAYIPFFVLLWLWLACMVQSLFLRWQRSWLWASGVTVFAVLRLIGLGHVVNALLVVSLIMVVEYYWKYRSE